MADLYGRKKAIEDAERKATEGDKPKEDHCADAKAKVERNTGARKRLAQMELDACRARQSTDSNN